MALLCTAAAVVVAAAACCSKLLLFQHRDRLIMGVFRILLAKTLISIRLVTVKCKATGVSQVRNLTVIHGLIDIISKGP